MSSGYAPYGGTQGPLCERCRTPLQPNEANCRNCGYYNAPVQGNPVSLTPSSSNGQWGNFPPQPTQGPNPSGPPSWGQFPVSPSSANLAPSPQAQNSFTNPPSAPVPSSGRNLFGVPVKPANPNSIVNNNEYIANQVSSAFTEPPSPFVAPQRPSGVLSTGPVGSQPLTSPSMGPISQSPYGMPPPNSLQYGASSVTGQQYGAPPVTGQQYGAPPVTGQQYGASPVTGQQYSGGGPSDRARSQSGELQQVSPYSSSSDLPGFAQPAFKESVPTRKSPKPWIIVLIAVLLIMIVGGGFVGYTLIKRNGAATVNPTVVPAGAKTVPILTDAFKSNANGWDLRSDPGIFSSSISNGALVLEDNNNELLWELFPGSKTYSDFSLSVDAMLSQGDQTNGYGIYIRSSAIQNSELATYYRFELYGDGSYAVFKGAMDAAGNLASSKLVDYTLSSAIHKQGVLNHIAIIAKGSSLQLSVNGQVVKMITDSSYANGSIAFFVSNMQNAKRGAEAKFSNLVMSQA